MAARRIYESPPEQMTRLAVVARLNGQTFEEWWEQCVRPGRPPCLTTWKAKPPGAVAWPSDSVESRQWRDAMEATREVWRRSFELLPPTRSDVAVSRLGPLLRAARAASVDAAA